MTTLDGPQDSLETLRDSSASFHMLADYVSDSAVYLIDPEGHVATWNAGAERLKQYSAAEVIGQDFACFYLPEEASAGKPAADLARALAEGRVEAESWRRRKDGSLFRAHVVLTPVFGDGGNHLGFGKVTRDISRQLSQAHMRSVLDNVVEGVFSTDEHGIIQSFNLAAERLFGYAAGDVIGQDLRLLVEGQDAATDAISLGVIFQPGIKPVRSSSRFQGRRKNSSTFPMELSISHFELEGRLFYTGIARDLTEQAVAEVALRRSQQQMEKAQQRGHIGHWELDVASNCSTWSEELYRIYGMVPQTAAVDPALTVSIHPADRAHVERALETARNDGGDDFQFEYRIQPDGGPVQYLELRGESLLGEDGRPETLEGTVQDITLRMQAEDALRKGQRRMESAQRVAHVGDWDWDCATDEIAWSDEYYRIFGLEPQSLKPDLAVALRLIHPEDRPRIQAEVEHAVATGEDLEFHYRLLRPDGELRYIEGRGECIPEDGAEVCKSPFTHWAGIVHDVTDRTHEELRLRAILDNASDGIITVDETGTVVSFSRTAETMFRYTAADIVGTSVLLLAPAEQRPYFDQTIRRMCRGELAEQRSVLGTGLRSDGSEFPFELSLNVFSLGDKPYVIGINRDITERTKLEEQLRQSQKMEAIGRLAGGVAHDFNNLLTVIIAYSQMMLEKVPEDKELTEFTTEVLHAGERAALLTHQLLAFSRQQVLAPKVLDLNPIVAETERMLQRLIGEDITIYTSLASDLDPILIDHGQIIQVIMNLAVNARDAMPQGGKLTIQTRNYLVDEDRAHLLPEYTPGPHVLLSISDNGAGMTAEVRERIFEPFFTTKGPGLGTGLGLSTVYGIVKQSGGQIEVYSEPGSGTTFKVYFPAVEQQARQQAAVLSLPVSRGTETLLLVEDDAAVRKVALAVLVQAGYEVLEAAHGRAALELAKAHVAGINLLVTDLIMPEMSGRQVAEAVQLILPGVRVLYMSGYTDDAVVRHGLVADSVSFLQKPFTSTSLCQKVREVLDRPN